MMTMVIVRPFTQRNDPVTGGVVPFSGLSRVLGRRRCDVRLSIFWHTIVPWAVVRVGPYPTAEADNAVIAREVSQRRAGMVE